MTDHTFAADRYEKMNYRHCGRSGLQLPEISLGFWQSLGEPQNEAICRDVMYAAFDNGVTHFDLANNYGPPAGNSEISVGKILKDMPRDELIVSTKAGHHMWDGPYGNWGGRKYMIASLDQSLKRLGLDYVDIYYHHRPDPDTPLEETLSTLDLIVRQGKALYVGVSNYPGALFAKATELIKLHDWQPLTIHQPYYNMLGRSVEWDLLPQTERAGTGVIPFCPLAEGYLTDRYLDGLPADSRFGRQGEAGRARYEGEEKKGTWAKVRQLREIARQRGQSTAQLALTWLLRDPRVTSVLIGASRVEQLLENLKVVKAEPLSAEEIAQIEAILKNGSPVG